MEKEHPSLAKTCSICGELKPLSAFLQMSGSSGAEYGSVCVDCRKKGADQLIAPETDESTRSSSGVVIDSKSKLEADISKREERERTEEDYYEEREEAGTEQKLEEDKGELKSSQEKYHRKTFLDRSFLGTKKQNAPADARWRTEQITKEATTAEAATQLEQTTKEELREKGLDESSTEDLRQGMKEKHKGVAFRQGAAFQSFAARLGKSSTFTQGTPTDPSAADTLAESIEKHWGPGRKK